MSTRIQRKRTKGWRMPEGAVYVGRPSRWGNLFRVGQRPHRVHHGFGSPPQGRPCSCPPIATVGEAVDRYRRLMRLKLAEHPTLLDPLRGRDLACWCPLDQPCHTDVLLELASPTREEPEPPC